MKKTSLLVLTLASVLGLGACGTKQEPSQEVAETKAPFEVGTDTATYEVDGHSDYAGTVCANVQIKAGETILFSGKVTVTSDSCYAHEFFKAACEEKSLTQEGLEAGFVTTIGSYASNYETNTYWMWYYNGHNPTNFSVNDVHVFEGDYLQYSYETVNWA